MAEGEKVPNGEDVLDTGEYAEHHKKLLDSGIIKKVADELISIYKSGLMSPDELDERATDALKEFTAEAGVEVLKQFKDSNLEHVGNKSAFLCGVMKTYRQKNKVAAGGSGDGAARKGPNEAKIKEILDRTGYSLDVTTGQRKYGGPPPDWDGKQPGAGHEVFCGKIPKDIFEDELIPLFEQCGQIWDLRLMMDPMTGLNRGYCFVTFTDKDGASEGVNKFDNYEIRTGKRLKVNVSVANLRLFVGNIPKSKSRDEILDEFGKLTEDLQDVIIYSSPDDPKKKNRGFAFLEYDSHKTASTAKRKLGTGRVRVWGCDIIVDWADPIEEPDNDTMSKVKVLYVRNLKSEVTEEQLKEAFEEHGKVERVKKIKDYGFVHFAERDEAVKAMNALNGTRLGESEIQISLAKPPSENRQKEKRKREQQQQRMMMQRGFGYDDYWGSPMMSPRGMMGVGPQGGGSGSGPRGGGGNGGGMRRPHPGRGGGGYDLDYDYYGYGDYRGGYADPYYDDYYGYDFGDDFFGGGGGAFGGGGPGGRGRAGRPGPPHPPPGRGVRGAGPMGRGARGGPGAAVMGRVRGGARGTARGGLGGRGQASGMRGTGAGGSNRGSAVAGRGPNKRKGPGDNHTQGQTKKRNTDGNWGAQPIAQQPLAQSYDSQWYEDSYSQQWG